MEDRKIYRKELLELLGCSNITITRQIRAGNLPETLEDEQGEYFQSTDLAEALGVKDMNEPFIDTNEAANILEVSTHVILNWCKKKGCPIPFYKIKGNGYGRFMFRRSELVESKRVGIIRYSYFKTLQKKDEYFREFFAYLISVARVDQDTRLATHMFLLQDFSYHDIAKKMNTNQQRVRRLITEGLDELRKTVDIETMQKERSGIEDLRRENVLLSQKLEEVSRLSVEIMKKSDKKDLNGIMIEMKKVNLLDIPMSTRCKNAVKTLGISNLGDLSSMRSNDLIRYQGVGEKTVSELTEILYEYGLKWRT